MTPDISFFFQDPQTGEIYNIRVTEYVEVKLNENWIKESSFLEFSLSFSTC